MTTFARRLPRDAAAHRDLVVAVAGAALLVRQLVHAAGTPGIDFAHVWNAAHQLLGGSGAYRDPLFTYPPASALLLAPIGVLPYSAAKLVMLAANVAGVLGAAWLTVTALDRRFTRTALAVTLLTLGLLDAVGSTWANGNVNGIVLLLEAVAIRSMLAGRWLRAAGVLGVSLAVKPVLLPVVVVFLVRRQWRAAVIAVAGPAALSLLGWWVIPDAHRFVDVVVPFLMHGAQLPFNDSFVGVGHALGLTRGAVAALRVAVGAGAALVIARRARRSPTGTVAADDLVYLDLGLALAATFLVAPMSETYYTIFLLPSLAWWASRRPATAVAAGLITLTCFSTLRLAGVPGDIARMTPLALRPSIGWMALLCCLALPARHLRAVAAPAESVHPTGSSPPSRRGPASHLEPSASLGGEA